MLRKQLKTAEITAAEQRDNSENTAARTGEQRTAPQAELEIAIAENPVMRSIWERFFAGQEQIENVFFGFEFRLGWNAVIGLCPPDGEEAPKDPMGVWLATVAL